MSSSETKERKKSKKNDSIKMGAKIANQINTNQQSNMLLTAYSVITQSSSTVNINLA